jgi:DNA-binding GntR family transcriptional regulator
MDQLSDEYGAAGGTIDKALGVLRDLGIAETIHGTGTFVREPAPSEDDLAAEVAKLSERMKAMEERMDEFEASRHARG